MKRFELGIALLLLPIDFAMLLFAATTAYFLRFETIVTKYRPVIFELPYPTYIELVVWLSLIAILIFAFNGLYSIHGARQLLGEMKKVVIACTSGFAATTMLIFLRGELFNSRFIVLAAWVIAVVYLILGRLIIRLVKLAFYKQGIGVLRVVLVGNDKNTKAIASEIEKQTRWGMMVVKKVRSVSKETLADLQASLKQAKPDLILLSSVRVDRKDAQKLLNFANEHHLQFSYVADVFDANAINTTTSTLADTPLIEIKQTPLEGWGRIYKRTFDIIAGLFLFIITLPIVLLIALAIKLDSRGPVIYKNKRVGKNGKLFNLYKFRRLKIEYCTGDEYDKEGKAEKMQEELIKKQSVREGPLYKIANDPRSTRVGRILEKTSLDELPQFMNVLLGNMSLVGPRPHQPSEVDNYERHHKSLLSIKPGITGLAQISGRSDLDFEDEYTLDIFYIQNWSIRTDIAILLKTPFTLLKRRKSQS